MKSERSTLHVFDHAGHLPQVEQPEQFVALLRSFAGGLSSRAGSCAPSEVRRGALTNPPPTGDGSGRVLGSSRDPPKPRPSLHRGSRHGHERRSRAILNGMQALKAHVKSGRIIVDEPTDLPEGAEL